MSEREGEERHFDISRMLEQTTKEIEDLSTRLEGLQQTYERAGARVRAETEDDIDYIHHARSEVGRLVALIRGGSLFGRYQADADHHQREADKWRRRSIGVLAGTPIAAYGLFWTTHVSGALLGVAMSPLLVLFLYLSLESSNHRRREVDRRRIALRMAAIESFMERRAGEAAEPASGSDGSSAAERARAADELLDEFIRKHFIEPHLDSNDMSYLGPRYSVVTLMHRGTAPPQGETGHAKSSV